MSNLKYFRERAGLSQSKLANKADVNIRLIQTCEIGQRDINKVQGLTLYKLSKALGVKIEDLLQLDKN